MKKALALLLSLFLISQMMQICFAIDLKNDDFDSFSEDVISLIQDYSSQENNPVSAESYSVARTTVQNTDATENAHLTNRLIVKSKTKPDVLNSSECISGYNDLFVFQFENAEDTEYAYNYYSALNYIEYVQYDSFCFADEIIADSSNENAATIPTQTQSEVFKFNALNKYLSDNNITYEDELSVAIVDTGIAYDHTYLKDRVVSTGFDSVNNNSDYDDNSHGTHVAGIVVANSLENVILKPYKVLNSDMRGTELQVYLGIQAAANDGADIINLSLSIVGESDILHDAVKYACDKGAVVICSAGNNGVDLTNTKYSPACFDEVITVGSCKNTKQISDFSNYGSKCDIFAPGEDVISTGLANTFISKTGTSMSAPFITAAVSYILLDSPNSDFSVVKNKLLRNTAPCTSVKNGLYINAEFLTRTLPKIPAPTFSYTKSYFSEPFELTLSTSITDGEIYYKTSDFDNDEYVLYSEPITVNFDMTVYAYVIADGYETSDITNYFYNRSPQDASLFTVDSNGTLTDYAGESQDIVVPAKVNSKYVKSISPTLFKNNKNIRSVMFQAYMVSIPSEAFYGCDNLRYIRAKGVTSIGENAFENCINLKQFVGSKVNTVSDYAFYGCDKFKNFDFTSTQTVGNSAFENINLTTISPNSIVTVGSKAFKNTGLTYITLNNAVSVGDYAFANCSKLSSVTFLKLENLGEYAFAESPNLLRISLGGLKSISENAFLNDTLLESVMAPDLQSLPDGIFSNLSALTKVEFDTVTVIGDEVFNNCTDLSVLKLPKVTSLGNSVFNGCKNIVNVDFPELTELGANVFKNCIGLKKVELNSMTSIDFADFTDCKFIEEFSCNSATELKYFDNSVTFTDDYNISLLFPALTFFSADSVLSLPDYMFCGSSDLAKVSFAAIESVGKYAFYNCDELSDLNAPNLKVLNEYAFCGCKKLKPTIENISDLYSNALNGVIFEANTIFSDLQFAGENAFEGCDIERAIFPKIVYAADLPRNGIILIATEGNGKIESGIKTEATIYAINGSFAQSDAQQAGYKFVEYNEQTAVMNQPGDKRYNNKQNFVFDILTAKCNYQWYYLDSYGNETTYTNKTGSEIEINGHISDIGFYCVAVSKVGGKEFTITSNVVKNIFASVKNNLNSENIIFDSDNKILLSLKKQITDVSDFLKTDDIDVDIVPSVEFNGELCYGTGTVIYLLDENGERFDKYTLCVKGDADGDGVVDIIDIAQCERVVNSGYVLQDEFMYSLDLNQNKTVDITDYQNLVNYALA